MFWVVVCGVRHVYGGCLPPQLLASFHFAVVAAVAAAAVAQLGEAVAQGLLHAGHVSNKTVAGRQPINFFTVNIEK